MTLKSIEDRLLDVERDVCRLNRLNRLARITDETTFDMVTMRLRGKTLEDIGKKYGVKRQAVDQRLQLFLKRLEVLSGRR